MATSTIGKVREFDVVARLGSSDDLNSLNKRDRTGIYQITSGVSNAPANWSILFNVCVSDNGYTAQMVFTHLGIWTRLYSGNPLAWETWRHVTLTT